jgi:hypothetical protein
MLVGGLGFGLGLQVCCPRTAARGIVLSVAIAVLFLAYSPAAALHGPWSVFALDVAIGLVLASALGRTSRLQQCADRTLGLVIGSFALALVVTAARIPAAIVAQAQFAILATGAFLTMRASTPDERRVFLRGLVLIGVAESVAALYELLVLGRPGFWDYTTSSDSPAGVTLPNPFLGDAVLRMAGTTGHPIALAFLLSVATSVVCADRRVVPSPWLRRVILAVLAAGLLAAGTRNAAIALVAASGYLVTTSDARRRGLRIAVSVTAGGIAIALGAEALLVQVGALIDSGSYTNRAGSIASVPGLVGDRPILEVLTGSGWGSEGRLFERGFLNQNGFGIVDNQFVTTLATAGVIGLALLVSVGVSAWRHGDRTVRSVLVVVVVMAFSFDFMRWAGVTLLVFGLLAIHPRTAPRTGAPPSTESPATKPIGGPA